MKPSPSPKRMSFIRQPPQLVSSLFRSIARLTGPIVFALVFFIPAIVHGELVLQTLYRFGTNNPLASLIQTSNGDFYGVTASGGTAGGGTIFRFNPTGSLTTLVFFSNGPVQSGYGPSGKLVEARDDNLYGTTTWGGPDGNGTFFRITPGGALTTLFNFRDQTTGVRPYGSLAYGSDGNFYGTTEGGEGVAFMVTPNGEFKVLHFFSSRDGYQPLGDMVEAPSGTFWGATSLGGPNGDFIFTIDTNGTFATIYTFGFTNDVGFVRFIAGKDGNFYGTETGGLGNSGSVFRLTPQGDFTNLATFGGTNGAGPLDLIQSNDGAFYGITGYQIEGTSNLGTVFKISTNGVLTTLVKFNGANGRKPRRLLQGRDGNIYGVTEGSADFDAGTIFRLVEEPQMTARLAPDKSVTLSWNSFINGQYRVEYKSRFDETNWTLLSQVTGSSNTLRLGAPMAGGTEHFFRVVLLP